MASGAVPIPAFGDGSSYVKLSDGTLIQWGFKGVDNFATDAYYADNTIAYPVAFHSSTVTPLVICTNVAYSYGTSREWNVCIPTAVELNDSNDPSTRLTSFVLRVWKQYEANIQNQPSPTIAWVAIGRWK